MVDFLDVLAHDVRESIERGYYEVEFPAWRIPVSLKRAIAECSRAPIIAEIKLASPSLGVIKEEVNVEEVALAMKKGGAIGISVLTEPKHFKGSLDAFIRVRKCVDLPLLMKDVILSPVQLGAASKIGANAVLLIEALFNRGYCECDLDTMIACAQSMDLEVLLETHTENEFVSALNTKADLIGINNRNLRTLEVDLNVSKRILQKNNPSGKVVISESGIQTPADIRTLHEYGVDAFLVGSAIMRATNIEAKVRELVHAL